VKENSNAEFFYSAGGTGSDCRPAGGPASILVRCLRGAGSFDSLRAGSCGGAQGKAGIGIAGKMPVLHVSVALDVSVEIVRTGFGLSDGER
jgi:hypothetical protein